MSFPPVMLYVNYFSRLCEHAVLAVRRRPQPVSIQPSNPRHTLLSHRLTSHPVSLKPLNLLLFASQCIHCDLLFPDDVNPGRSQREAQHFHLYRLQLCLLSFPQCHYLRHTALLVTPLLCATQNVFSFSVLYPEYCI